MLRYKGVNTLQQLVLKDMGNRIRRQREFLGYTREQLAEKLDVTPKFCSDIELGVKGMSLQTLCNLSGILKLSTDYILFGVTRSPAAISEGLSYMLYNCPPNKISFAEEILKSFLLALD